MFQAKHSDDRIEERICRNHDNASLLGAAIVNIQKNAGWTLDHHQPLVSTIIVHHIKCYNSLEDLGLPELDVPPIFQLSPFSFVKESTVLIEYK